MKTIAIVLGMTVLMVALIAAGIWVGTAWAQGRWPATAAGYSSMGRGMMGYGWEEASVGFPQDMPCGDSQDMPCGDSQDMPCGDSQDMPCSEGWWEYGMGSRGMMGPGAGGGGWENMPCGGAFTAPEKGDDVISLKDAKAAVEGYVDRLGYSGLHVTEVMEFERNFYAIVAEEDTGIGAMELLIGKDSGIVGLEPGPNMMWNAKYGMHGRGGGMMGMMGGFATGEMNLSPQEAEEVAQRWLDANLPGRTAGEADAFYGYYTLHFFNDGEIEGMLSVHGSSGDVWYHSWHGDFIAMDEDHS